MFTSNDLSKSYLPMLSTALDSILASANEVFSASIDDLTASLSSFIDAALIPAQSFTCLKEALSDISKSLLEINSDLAADIRSIDLSGLSAFSIANGTTATGKTEISDNTIIEVNDNFYHTAEEVLNFAETQIDLEPPQQVQDHLQKKTHKVSWAELRQDLMFYIGLVSLIIQMISQFSNNTNPK
ncbi:MAG: hypothetical protein LUH36_07190, partial [Oscillospiraceae bacterium]|nr:hypothetical protein [Oscillospiraceae bacterium]